MGSATVESGIPDGWMSLDIGTESVAKFVTVIEKSATIVWNGWVWLRLTFDLSHTLYPGRWEYLNLKSLQVVQRLYWMP